MLVFAIFGGVGALFVILGIFFLTGRNPFLLAGYNTMPENVRATYDGKALCKFIGKILLPIGILAPFAGAPFAGIEIIPEWFVWVWVAVMHVLLAFAIIYANTGNRFRNNRLGK